MDDLTERPLGSTELLRGRLLRVLRDDVRLPDGTTSEREYIVHPGAVLIVPMLQDAQGVMRLVLERQYRYPVRRVIIEFPAGKLDPGEAPLTCARRELREETGYRAREWARAGVVHPAVGYSDEAIEIWFARALQPGSRALDAGEHLEVITATAQELFEWARQGQVTDGKTLAAMLWLQHILEGTWAPDWQTVQGAA